MSRSYAAFASLSVFALLLGTSSIAAAQVMPPQPSNAPVGGVEFFLPTYVTPAGNCACWDSDGATNGGYDPATASAIFSVCYYPQVDPGGNPYNVYVTHHTVPTGSACGFEFVCGRPSYTDPLGNTVQARPMMVDGPESNPSTAVLYSEIQTNCTDCSMSPLKGWVGYQGGPMTGVAPQLLNMEYGQSYSQLGGIYNWSDGTWSGIAGNAMYDGNGYSLPYCTGSFDSISLPAFPPLNMTGGGGITEYPGQYELSPVEGGNTGGNVLSTADLTKALSAANGGMQMENMVEKKTTVVKGKNYTTYRTEIIVKPAPVKKEAAPVKVAPVIKK
jgi:hypothetical protein